MTMYRLLTNKCNACCPVSGPAVTAATGALQVWTWILLFGVTFSSGGVCLGGGGTETVPPSVIQVRIHVPLETVRREIEQAVPREFVHKQKGDFVGAAAGDEEIYVKLKRGDLKLEVPGPSVVVLSCKWTAEVVKWSGKSLFRATVGSRDCSGTLSARARFTIDPHTWHPIVAELALDGRVERCFVKGPFGIGNINLRGVVDPAFRKTIREAAKGLREKLNDKLKQQIPDLAKELAPRLRKMQHGIAIARKPKTWLRLVPLAAHYEPLAQREARLETTVAFVSRVEVMVADSRPESWQVGEFVVPKLTEKKIHDPGFRIPFVATADWKRLTEIINQNAPHRIVLSRDPKLEVTIGSIRNLGADAMGRITATLHDVKITGLGKHVPANLQVRFRLRYDSEAERIVVEELSVNPEVKAQIGAVLAALISASFNNQKVRISLRKPLKALKDQGTHAAQAWKKQFGLEVQFKQVRLQTIRTTPMGLVLEALVSGTATWSPSL